VLLEKFNLQETAKPIGPERDAAFEFALSELERRKDEFARMSHVPRDFIDLLVQAGIYRAATPAAFGGQPESPSEFMRKIERISSVDPSTGWVASFGSALTYFSALPRESQASIYANGVDIVFAGGMFPMIEAQRVDRGWIANGTWFFASGCKGADILGVGLRGGPETDGRPLTALVHPEDVTIEENWDVAGMKSTGSHNVRVTDLFIPDEMTFIRGGTPTVNEPITRYPALPYAAQVLAVTTLGAGRGALDYVRKHGSAKASVTGGAAKGNRPTYKIGLAHAEADLRAARAFFYSSTDSVWRKAVANEEITTEDKALLRLASSHAAQAGRKVVLAAFELAGTGAIFNGHPLQNFLQDGLVPAQHAMLQENTFEAAGSLMLGLDAGIPSFP
jgi:alkylation response protein AidB-like acyl-CoA dehydrogenase